MSHNHLHRAHAKAVLKEEDQYVQTVVSVVWVTAEPDSPAASSTPSVAATSQRVNGTPLSSTRVSSAETTSAYRAPPRQQRPDQTMSHASVLPTAIIMQSSSVISSNALTSGVKAKATTLAIESSVGLAASSSILAASSFNIAAPIATSSTSSDDKTSSGLSGGAKAGVAFAVLIGIALLAAAALFVYRRKRKQQEEHQRLDDEKTDLRKRPQSIASQVSFRSSQSSAPRLSLRPVDQMFPPMSEKSDAGFMVAGAAAAARARSPEPSSQSPTENPFDDSAEDKSELATPVAAAAPIPLMVKNGQNAQADGQSFPAAVAGSRRNSPPGPGPNNVHRVQLDFKPSMEDELELRAGSLVRLLHEYDDGWALCIRLDRSQQGVVPRTCVSKLPVKPRPAPPPGARAPPAQGRGRNGSNAPGPRGSPPNGAARPMPPAGARVRAQSNAPRRPQSPGQFAQNGSQARPRANSDAMSARRMSPTSSVSSTGSGPSSPPQAYQVPARKPVPGQPGQAM